MLKKLLSLFIVCSSLVACASWFGSSSTTPEADNPAIGSKDGSNQLFGPAASAPVSASSAKAAKPNPTM